jgi:hypothetical protein
MLLQELTISAVCSPKSNRKTGGGYLWSYSENEPDISYIAAARRGVVYRYTIEGAYIDTFQSFKDASIFVNGDKARIHLCARPPYINIAYGFRWSKEKVRQLNSPPARLCIEVRKYDTHGIFACTYGSLVKAAQSINRKLSGHISVCLNDHWRKAGGYYWRTYKADKIEIPIKKGRRGLHG